MSDSEFATKDENKSFSNQMESLLSDDIGVSNSVLEKRMQRIARKRQLLDKIGIAETIRDLQAEKEKIVERKKRQIDKEAPKQLRHSRRLQGKEPEFVVTSDTLDKLLKFEGKDIKKEKTDVDDASLVNSVEYWKNKQNGDPFISNGHYSGWIDPEVIKRHNLPETEEEFIIQSSNSKSKSSGMNFKEKAHSSLHSNPNCYFYRFCEPGVDQWTGKWTSEEIDRFMSTVQQFGCGDRWGLFSTYIPHRVGYQCANFYRQYILPKGLVADPSYFINSSGKAIFKNTVKDL